KVNSYDLRIIIKVVLNRRIAGCRRYDDSLAYEQTRLFIEVKPLRRVAFRETDNEVSIAVANFFDAAQHHSRILLLQVQRLVKVGATFHASQRRQRSIRWCGRLADGAVRGLNPGNT